MLMMVFKGIPPVTMCQNTSYHYVAQNLLNYLSSYLLTNLESGVYSSLLAALINNCRTSSSYRRNSIWIHVTMIYKWLAKWWWIVICYKNHFSVQSILMLVVWCNDHESAYARILLSFVWKRTKNNFVNNCYIYTIFELKE